MDFDGPIEHPHEYLEFFRLFNARRFFEAHEVLEDLWVLEAGEARNFYKGLIMMAVGLCHWVRGNPGAARRLYLSARGYLSEYPPVFEDFAVQGFLGEMDLLFQPLMRDTSASAPRDDQIPVLALNEQG